ncbi:SDR family oxidoreductase [Pedobacter sp. Leaf194]|uniref:SDR family oxidoreductase n=1 Tax=Pedobacter sp. Leaf194 TaxID=1736297 RepID=UPI00070262F2|nr:SDR family NAD(P)-dependent oxidoreductase [Pedobacter sp. Leaf194]KQS36009.1 cytochrome C [Pedobacter sp. Leaf194]
MKIAGNKILITGGATGIGLGLTERFLKENNTVIICGRRTSALEEVRNTFPSVTTRVCDLANAKERLDLFSWIEEHHPDLNVLVNNAGIQNWVDVRDNDLYDKAKNEVEINVLAPIHLTNLFLKLKSLDTIMNVSSGLAFAPLSRVPVYCATKAFLRSFTLSLRHQLKNENVEVIEIIPPALNTELGGTGLHNEYPPVSDFIESIFNQLLEGKNELTFGTSEPRAKANNDAISAYFKMMNP